MDVLRKELETFYESQKLGEERLDYDVLSECKRSVATAVEVEGDCRVITDAAADVCHIYGAAFARLMGLCDTDLYSSLTDSSDEDEIYARIHPEDLVEKRMLEYEYFKYIDTQPDERKLDLKATCRIRIKDRNGRFLHVDNSTRVFRLSPKGKVWLILCCYSLSPCQEDVSDICSRIVDVRTGKIRSLHLSDRRSKILTEREKEVLTLIKEGKLSKQIADILKISVHTVNRHRQNILEKLSVGNSMEAIMAATAMRLL